MNEIDTLTAPLRTWGWDDGRQSAYVESGSVLPPARVVAQHRGEYVLQAPWGRAIGVAPGRLRLEWISAAEGTRFAEIMSDFAEQLRDLGPIGRGEGIEADDLKLKLEAVNSLVPYLKLVEREKLRIPEKSEQAYKEFYESDATNQLFDDLIADKLAVSQILRLLRANPLSTREISERLGLDPSDVARHMNASSRQSLVRYDLDRKCYALAGESRQAAE